MLRITKMIAEAWDRNSLGEVCPPVQMTLSG